MSKSSILRNCLRFDLQALFIFIALAAWLSCQYGYALQRHQKARNLRAYGAAVFFETSLDGVDLRLLCYTVAFNGAKDDEMPLDTVNVISGAANRQQLVVIIPAFSITGDPERFIEMVLSLPSVGRVIICGDTEAVETDAEIRQVTEGLHEAGIKTQFVLIDNPVG